jgi:hypothetical protein
MIKWMIKAHPTESRMPRRARPIETIPAAVLDGSMSEVGTDGSAE